MKKFYELQNYVAFNFLSVALAMVLVGAIFIGMTVQDVISSSKAPVDFNEISESQCKPGTHVTGDVYGTIGYYWESYHTTNGVKQESSTERIYLIPYGTEGKYIGLNVRKHEFEKMDDLENATYEAFENNEFPKPLTGYEGYIKKCDGRMKAALEDAYLALGGDGDVNEIFVPYYIEQSSGTSMTMTLIGVGFLAAAAVFFVLFATKLKKEKMMMGNSVYLGKIIFDRNDYLAQIRPIQQEYDNSANLDIEETPEMSEPEEMINEVWKNETFDTGESDSKFNLRMKSEE
ncbi:MAG: DUF6709 family protein [Lachnospiraceae bacterium]